MTIHFHDPRGEGRRPAEAYTCRLDDDDACSIGLLANGFPDSVRFLDAVEQALAAVLPGARFRRWDKGNASVPAKPALMAEIADACDALVTAYGH